MLKRNLVLGVLLIMLLAMSTNLLATTYTVGASGCNFTTIQAAINDAGTFNGDIISVEDATHTEAGITVNKNLTIQGQGAGSTIVQAHANQGSATDRVFEIASGNTVTLKDMTIQHGKVGGVLDGGGIFNNGTLVLMNCTVSGNSAGSDGGGIRNNSTLTLENCTLSGNTAVNHNGGGIYNDGTVTLTNCTISGNTAAAGAGGGIRNKSTLTLTNCTISGNTCKYNGGGIYNDGSEHLYIKNTLIANNNTSDGIYADFYKDSGTVTNNGYNAVESSNYDFLTGTGCYTGTQCGDHLSNTLEENHTLNGTETLKTTLGSVAIDAGTSGGAPTTDQRGAGRNGTTDIGAYEYWDDAGSLPVELSTFTAQFIENTPTLYWSTQSETDNMGWFVYRNEENDFTTSKKISEFIEGHGTTTQQHSYLYEDNIENPEVGDIYYYWLESIDYSGMVNHYDKVAQLTIPDQPDPGSGLIPEPVRYGLFQNEPNPVISSTKISFNLHQTAKVELKIYNLKGQLVKSLYSGVASSKTLDWDGTDESGKNLQAGVYLYKLLVNGKTAETKKLIIIK